MIRAAVVGLGIGMAHVAGYLESEEAELYAVCDLIESRRDRVGGTFDFGSMLCLRPLFDESLLSRRWQEIGVKVFTSFEMLLEDPLVDVVSICTPDYLHPEHLRLAMDSGKHILLEKPVGISLEEAERLAPAVAAYPKKISIGYEFRINPAITRMRRIVRSGEIGEVEAFSLYHFRTPFLRDKWNQWIQKREYSGGLVVEETCHWFDLAAYITGKRIGELSCLTTPSILDDFDFEDVAYIQGRYVQGGIFQISHALTGFDFSLQLTVHGTKGTLWCNLKEESHSLLDAGSTDHWGILCKGAPNAPKQEVTTWVYGSEVSEAENIRDYVKSFCSQIVNDQRPMATFDDGLVSLKASLQALEAAKNA